MGETTPTSWKSGFIGLLVLLAIFAVGSYVSRNDVDPQPVHVQLSCQHFPDGRYDCVQP